MAGGIKIASGFQATSPATGAVTLGLPTGSIVFKPGGGATTQNVYTDPLLLEQAAQASVGVLGPKTVFLDFSANAGSYSATADIDLGTQTALEGLNATSGETLAMGAHQLSPPRKIANVHLFATGAGPGFSAVPGGYSLELSGNSELGGALLWTVAAGQLHTILLRDIASFGNGAVPSVHVATGARVIAYLFDQASLNQTAFSFSGTGRLSIIAETTATIGSLYFNNPNVDVTFLPLLEGPFVFQPNGSQVPPFLYADQATLIEILSQSLPVPVEIQCDFSQNGDAYTLTDDFSFGAPSTIALVGVTNQQTDSPPAFATGGFTLDPNISSIRNINLAVSLAQAQATGIRALDLVDTTLTSSDGNLYTTIQAFGTSTFVARHSQIGDGINPVLDVPAGGILNLSLLELSNLKAGAITVDFGGAMNVTIEPGSFVDPTYYSMSGVTCIFTAAPSARVAFSPFGVNGPNTFTDFGQLCAYCAAVGPLVESWTIEFGDAGSSPVIPAGTYALPLDVTFTTTAGNNANGLTINDANFSPPPVLFTVENLVIEWNNNAYPGMIVQASSGPMFAEIRGGFGQINCVGTQPWVAVSGVNLGLTLKDDVILQGSTASISFDATSSALVRMYDQSQIPFLSAFDLAVGATVDIRADAAVVLNLPPPAGITVTFEAQASQVTYTPAQLVDWSGVAPASVADALDRIAAKLTPIP